MAWTLVQTSTVYNNVSPASVTLTSTTAGNLLVAVCTMGAVSAPTVTTSGFSLRSQALDTTAGQGSAATVWEYPNNPGGITTVGATGSANVFLVTFEFSCTNVASAAVDKTGTATGVNATSDPVSTSAAVTANNELAVAGINVHFSSATVATLTQGTGFTSGASGNQGASNAAHHMVAYQLDTGSSSGSTVTHSATCSVAGTGHFAHAIATYPQPAAGGLLPQQLRVREVAAMLINGRPSRASYGR